jgi:hypothetical protein
MCKYAQNTTNNNMVSTRRKYDGMDHEKIIVGPKVGELHNPTSSR